MSESTFQRSVMRSLRKAGFIVKHLSPPTEPGYPDLTVWRGNFCVLVELKMVKGKRGKFASQFTRAQFPWGIRWLQEGGAPYFILTDAGHIEITTPDQLEELYGKRIEDIAFQPTSDFALFLQVYEDIRNHLPS